MRKTAIAAAMVVVRVAAVHRRVAAVRAAASPANPETVRVRRILLHKIYV